MSLSTNPTTTGHRDELRPVRPSTGETKASHKTTELFAYVITAIAVLVASAVADDGSDFGAQAAWFFVTLLTIGYMLSRRLAKSGSRENYSNDAR